MGRPLLAGLCLLLPSAVIDDTDLGFPVERLREIPKGEYYVQAFVNIYSEFKRGDGHVVWMHDDQWEGQRWWAAPGNLASRVQKLALDASQGYRIALVADQKLPPVPPSRPRSAGVRVRAPWRPRFPCRAAAQTC